jgi:replicative DNA helicase
MATVKGGIVGFFSLEMSAEQLATRIVAEQTAIASNKIRRGLLNEGDLAKTRETKTQLQILPLYIDDTGGLSIAQVAARSRRLKRQRGLDLLVIDYVQLLQGTKNRNRDNRVQEITEITTSLKALAKELNIPILALSQLSRQVEQREDKRPLLSDLRESGSIEQDADVVLFVFREAYYHALQKPDDDQKFPAWAARAEEIHNRAEIIIAKHRHGPTETVELNFEPDLTKFSCRERRYDSNLKSHENVYH